MSTGMKGSELKCADVRRSFRAVGDGTAPEHLRDAVERHASACRRCGVDYRISRLEHTVLDLASAARQEVPDEQFFRSVRARIARGPVPPARIAADNTWSSQVWISARQLIPAVTMFLLLMIGVTLLWGSAVSESDLPPIERLMLSEAYDYQPTTDDVLESLVSVEDNQNGK